MVNGHMSKIMVHDHRAKGQRPCVMAQRSPGSEVKGHGAKVKGHGPWGQRSWGKRSWVKGQIPVHKQDLG